MEDSTKAKYTNVWYTLSFPKKTQGNEKQISNRDIFSFEKFFKIKLIKQNSYYQMVS